MLCFHQSVDLASIECAVGELALHGELVGDVVPGVVLVVPGIGLHDLLDFGGQITIVILLLIEELIELT